MNRSFFVLPLVLLLLLSLPQSSVDGIRLRTVGAAIAFEPSKRSFENIDLQNLQLENQQLRNQLDLVYEWFNSEKRLREQVEFFQDLQSDRKLASDYQARRIQEMKDLLQKETLAAFAKIIYRDPGSWSSSCWIDVGEENNLALGQKIVAKNSPVVSGASLVGVIEFVGRKQSRVRLITDCSLKTAVRAVRGSIIDREIAMVAHTLLDRLKNKPNFESLKEGLRSLHESLPVSWKDEYFAKGEVFGASLPYYRSLQPVLKGIGFSADFKDDEGTAKDLRDSILQVGDVLVTSGLDGIFPPGLKVAIVSKIGDLRTGDFSYELEASPIVNNLTEISSLSVLPPRGID